MAIKDFTKVAQLRSRLYKENRPWKEGHPPSPDSFLACGPRMKRWQTSYLAKLVSLAYKLSLRTSFSSSNALRHRLMSIRKVLTPLHKPTTMAHALIIQKSAPTHALFLSPRSSCLAAGRASVKKFLLGEATSITSSPDVLSTSVSAD